MIRYRIMNIRAYSAPLQMPLKGGAIAAANDEQMGDIIGAETLRAFDPRMLDLFPIPAGDGAPIVVPAVKTRKLRQQQRRLQLVQAAVAASCPAHVIFPVPAILTQLPNALGYGSAVRRHRSAIAERAKIFGGTK